jgi:hypothetical protein
MVEELQSQRGRNTNLYNSIVHVSSLKIFQHLIGIKDSANTIAKKNNTSL